ncbi:MAG TPA: hypothetical protein VKZ41_03300 [Gemmatimonadales bacterium]|nr:hypothetical protein [Gemmatimonadales bacterium]
MITHIDVSVVLRRRVCELYSDLVTRSTGAAVRSAIELQLQSSGTRTLIVMDFTNVGLLDFSCADEVVAKLLLRYSAEDGPAQERYFVFRGLDEHLDAIEQVLEHHGLALVAEDGDEFPRLVGAIGESERMAWEVLRSVPRGLPSRVAEELRIPANEASRLLEQLHRRRLCIRVEDGYRSVGGEGRLS